MPLGNKNVYLLQLSEIISDRFSYTSSANFKNTFFLKHLWTVLLQETLVNKERKCPPLGSDGKVVGVFFFFNYKVYL